MRRLGRIAAWLMLSTGWAEAQSGNPPPNGPPPGYLEHMEACAAEHYALTTALKQARLPFNFTGYQSDPKLEFTPRCALTKIFGSGTVSRTALDHVLKKSGFDVDLDEVTTAPPSTFPPTTGDTWPISAEAMAIAPQKSGSVLKAHVKLRNWTVFQQALGWGMGSVDYILLDERGEAVRWNGDGLIGMVGFLGSCPPLRACNLLSVNVPLDHFNPDLPLAPGRYTLRLRVENVFVSGSTFSATLPDQRFEIVP